LPRRAVRLWHRRRFRRRSRRDRCPLRSARRSGAETPALIVAECLRLRHAGDRLHYGLCRLHRRLQLAWPAWTRLAALMPLSCAVQILWPHLHGTGNPLGARQDTGLHTEGLHRSTRSSGNNAGSDARIDCEAYAVVAML
jgi:hypothetical protein